MRYFKISEDELRQLLQCRNELAALECMGVDNWSGWDEIHNDEFGWNAETYEFFHDSELEDFEEVK